MVRNVEEHCKKLGERMQIMQQEFQEQSKKNEQLVFNLKHYPVSSRHFLLTKWWGMRWGVILKGYYRLQQGATLKEYLQKGKVLREEMQIMDMNNIELCLIQDFLGWI